MHVYMTTYIYIYWLFNIHICLCVSIWDIYLFKWINKHVKQVKHVHVHLNGSSIVGMCLHMLIYICIWIIHIYRHKNICLFSCIFICISNRVISAGIFVHIVHIHLKDGIGVDICMRYACVYMQIYMFTCKPTYVH